MTTFYRVRDWGKHFENNRTRELKKMDWVPVPNKHDGDGFTELLDHENGVAHYGAWHLILQVASKCDPRGTLLRDGAGGGKIPHTPQSLARITHGNARVFEEAIERLVSIGWLEVCENPAPSCGNPAPGCGRVPMERKGTEGNGTEGEGREGTGGPPPPDEKAFTLEDCRKAAAGIGIRPEWIDAFFARYDRQGWVLGNGRPITNLKSALTHYKNEQLAREKEATKQKPDLPTHKKERQEVCPACLSPRAGRTSCRNIEACALPDYLDDNGHTKWVMERI